SARMMEQQGRQLLLVDGKHSAEEERAAIQFLLDLRCDGVIIYPRFLTIDEMDDIVAQHKHPILVINRRLRQHDSYCIYADQQLTCSKAVEQLIALGHRDIAFITGSLDSPTGRERLAGYKAALAQHHIPLQEALIVEGKWQAQNGVTAVETLLAQGSTFSALVASNDEMAVGALKALATRGIAVPAQVAVLGFDDIPLAPFTIPALSSVKMPVTAMIEETLERLISMLDGGEMRNRKTFSGELVIRESIGPGPYAP
ncbi:substrate-binding domain-containing protein, partial [Serratia bockelmannii]|nr:substrate-binding domain-containing protein [Serratia bockelmannii]